MILEQNINLNLKESSDKGDSFLIDGESPNEARVLEAIRNIPYDHLLMFLKEYTIEFGDKIENGPSVLKIQLELKE